MAWKQFAGSFFSNKHQKRTMSAVNKLSGLAKPRNLTGLTKTEYVISKLDQIVNWVRFLFVVVG